MMSPEEQIAKLAELATNFGHVLKAIDEIRIQIKEQPTKADLREFVTAKEMEGLREQVRSIKADIDALKRESPGRLWELLVKGASGIGIMWGFVALVRDFFHLGGSK